MQAWEQFLQQQETELGPETVQKWLRSLKIQRFDACNLYLEAKDSFQALWFEEHMRGKAQAKLVNGNNKRIKIHLSIANVSTEAQKKGASSSKDYKEIKAAPFQLNYDELDPHCLFQHFVVSEENQLTHKLLCELAGLTSSSTASLGTFNPIYLYGPTGSGKTHLLMSLAHSFHAQGLRSIYVRAELFTDHVVAAIRAGGMSTFRQAYRNVDVLLVDDVHVFSRKGATQEEFFHTFNTLHLQGKQIILSARCPPQELQLIEPRLVSRFEWGIVLPLHPLDPNELQKMLQAKAQALHFFLPQKIQDFLVEMFTSNPKALIKAFEALVLRLHLDAHHSVQTLSVTAAQTLLSDLLAEEQKSALTWSKIIQAAAEYYGIPSEKILGKSQKRESALPRQIAMHLCREKLKLPYMKIGDLFSRDHSTVMASVKHIQQGLESDDRDIAGAWHAIAKKLQT
jgi:chromosomal replication initiator protein